MIELATSPRTPSPNACEAARALHTRWNRPLSRLDSLLTRHPVIAALQVEKARRLLDVRRPDIFVGTHRNTARLATLPGDLGPGAVDFTLVFRHPVFIRS